jgi:hypothetical protein
LYTVLYLCQIEQIDFPAHSTPFSGHHTITTWDMKNRRANIGARRRQEDTEQIPVPDTQILLYLCLASQVVIVLGTKFIITENKWLSRPRQSRLRKAVMRAQTRN